jgi:glycosyltransferase involved in cell wall biosynthesis
MASGTGELVHREDSTHTQGRLLQVRDCRRLSPGMAHRHNKAMPLVSVVMIFLNEERFIEEAVRSVREQTLTDWELVLVDDGSTDGSTQIARDLATSDERIRYLDHPGHQNRGTSVTRNVGVAHTTAPYVAFIDGDDVWMPEKLAEQVELLESMPDVALVCGAVLGWWSWDPAATKADTLDLTLEVAAERRFDPPEGALAAYPLGRGDFGSTDLIVRRTAFEAVGGFEERFRTIFEDQSLCMKIYLRYPIYISSRTWFLYRQHDASCCAQFSNVAWLRVQRVYLDWLKDHVEPLGDARVSAAVRRARRELVFLRLKAPAGEFRQYIKRIMPRVRPNWTQ